MSLIVFLELEVPFCILIVISAVKGIVEMSNSSPFLKSIADYMMVRRYSKRTIESYLYWIKHFIVYHKKRHPNETHADEVEKFLTHLARDRCVAIATQKIALNALAFLNNMPGVR
jgi:site-specific recombinase XerD